MEALVDAAEFWRGKRVLVTGHTGFKGGWLSLWLKKFGAEVYGYSLDPPSQPNFYQIARVGEQVLGNRASDICDLPQLISAYEDFAPEIVFHAAAQSLVRYSYEAPVETYLSNVMGTVNVLEAARKTTSVRVMVIVTSDKCYENKELVWGYREVDSIGGHDPYSSSKGCAELITSAYTRSYFNPTEYEQHHVAIASVRAGNVIGGGDWGADRLIPDVMRAIFAGRPIRIRYPCAIRPWQHVLEPIAAYVELAQRLWSDGPAFNGGWNFGPVDHDIRPVQWVVEQLISRWGDDAGWELDQALQQYEAYNLRLDCSKAHALLGWRPRWNLASALDRTVEWYKAYQVGQDMLQVSLKQLDQFIAVPFDENSYGARGG